MCAQYCVCAALLVQVVVAVGGCGGTPIRYYQPVVVPELVGAGPPAGGDCVVSVETFTSDAAFDDQRMVYRESAHRLDYYHFHRWSAAPGEISSTVLRETMRKTGVFRAVIGGLDPRAAVVLGGRVVAFEEIDEDDRWRAHVALELTLRDNRTGALLWSGLIEDHEPIASKSPEGVAAAISRVLTKLGTRAAEVIGSVGCKMAGALE